MDGNGGNHKLDAPVNPKKLRNSLKIALFYAILAFSGILRNMSDVWVCDSHQKGDSLPSIMEPFNTFMLRASFVETNLGIA